MHNLISQIAEIISNNLKGALPAPSEPQEYYTIEDVCARLHISKSTLHRHRKSGYIRPTVYVGRKPLFDEKAIAEYLKAFPAI